MSFSAPFNFKQTFVLFFFLIGFSLSAQNLIVNSVSTQNPCSGSEITITFTAKSNIFGTYSDSTVFTATLVQNSHTNTGSVIGTFSVPAYNFGGIFATNSNIVKTLALPAGVTGSNYKIYLSSSNPVNYLGTTPSPAFTIGAAPSGGTLQNQTICGGTIPSAFVLTGYSGSVVKWQSSATADFASAVNIAGTSATLPGSAIGAITQPLYIRAVIQSGSCQSYSSAALISLNTSTSWTGANGNQWNVASNWSCGAPGLGIDVTIPSGSTVVIDADAAAASLNIGSGATVTVVSNFDLTVKNAVAVAESGQLILQNNANLIQVNNAVNSGKIVVNRNSSALKRQDYTLWSSPVQGQNLLEFSPLTLTNRFYTYNTETNVYNAIASPSATDFETAKGYLIRMPNNHPSFAAIWHGQFTGTPNNGTITFPLTGAGAGKRFNLVGNPYPSPINIETFVMQNSANITGTLYFWRKTNNKLNPSYCSWTALGGFVNNGEDQVFDPNDVLQTAQGFFVEAKAGGTSVTFNNSQRAGNNAGQFFRMAAPERHRIWLNLTGDGGTYSQMLVGYIEGATMEEDQNIDGKYINDSPIALTTTIAGEDYAIQGRPLPFDASDVVPLKMTVADAGSYTIAIDHLDGLFADGQDIFLKDKLTGTINDLKAAPYIFSSEAGTFADRFEIVYGTALGIGNHEMQESRVDVYSHTGSIVVRSTDSAIEKVELFDIDGRLLVQRKAVGANEVVLSAPQASQVLIVRVTTEDNQTAIKKIVN